MDIFFSDLDNTLIYSYKRDIGGEKIVAEFLNGKEQSYMTKYTYDYLASARWLNLVPVTARTRQQFERIVCLKEFNVKYAIVNNGGKLLIDGAEDKSWSDETWRIAENQLEDLEQAVGILKKLYPEQVFHRPDPYMCYAKVNALQISPQSLCGELSREMKGENVTVQFDRSKIYLFASRVNKGNAVKRFRRMAGVGTAVAAGDGIMDVPMLNEADYAMAAERIAKNIITPNRVVFEGEQISDRICKEIQKLHLAGMMG